MRKIYSQSINNHSTQVAIDNLAKSLHVAQSRILETILNAIDIDDLAALITRQLSLKSTNTIRLDSPTSQLIRDEIAHSISLLSNRVIDAAAEGAKTGVMSLLETGETI
ncbi:hypothetical protein I5I61_22715 [Pseudomonas nitroreducens]|uniref:Flagellar motor switch protein FliG C-terminal domain-containing protein n=1 Tax=Pseudomonas nitroreducens TaxID=46680 RepID=A0ABS0KQA2_PSENT|nr:hypothetical protein [Pseudomonas nitroreducens]MBG6290276.1 hypothetical protein [Pseudomonas nitroreducens]